MILKWLRQSVPLDQLAGDIAATWVALAEDHLPKMLETLRPPFKHTFLSQPIDQSNLELNAFLAALGRFCIIMSAVPDDKKFELVGLVVANLFYRSPEGLTPELKDFVTFVSPRFVEYDSAIKTPTARGKGPIQALMIRFLDRFGTRDFDAAIVKSELVLVFALVEALASDQIKFLNEVSETFRLRRGVELAASKAYLELKRQHPEASARAILKAATRLGVAEWACKTYLELKRQRPEASTFAILQTATRLRYAAGAELTSNAIFPIAETLVSAGISEVSDLVDYAILILDAETNFVHDSPDGFPREVKNSFQKVVEQHCCQDVRFTTWDRRNPEPRNLEPPPDFEL